MINVIIPAYNCEETLARTLGSLLSQSSNEFHTTVIDDCSTQDIKAICDRFQELSINYIRNEKNLGCGMTRQVGIDNTTTEYFMFLDSDDMLTPYAIELANSRLVLDPDIIYSPVMNQEQGHLSIYDDNFTWCHGKVYKKAFIDGYGIKNSPDIRWADDSYFNSMCFELTNKIAKLDIPIALYSDNKNSVTKQQDYKNRQAAVHDFLNAMLKSCEFVSQFKDHVSHLNQTEVTIRQMAADYPEESELANKVLSYK